MPNEVLDSLSPEHCLNAWSDAVDSMRVESADAADALIALAEQHGAELTLLCIGALTNVAEAIRRNPDSMARLGEIVAMSGAFRTQHREANAAIDPEAADTVYRSGIPLRLVGFEEAAGSRLALDDYANPGAATPLTAMLTELATVYCVAYGTTDVTLCDVTAVCAALHPEWFEFRPATVAVELHGTVARGLTLVEADAFFNRVPTGSPRCRSRWTAAGSWCSTCSGPGCSAPARSEHGQHGRARNRRGPHEAGTDRRGTNRPDPRAVKRSVRPQSPCGGYDRRHDEPASCRPFPCPRRR